MGDQTEDVLGPIDYLVVEFPGNKFNGELLPELTSLVARGLVHVLDLAFVTKSADGEISMLELEDLDELAQAGLSGIAGFLADLIAEEDLIHAAELLEPNSSAAVLIWENSWAVPFVTAMRASGGSVIDTGRLAAADVLAALSATS